MEVEPMAAALQDIPLRVLVVDDDHDVADTTAELVGMWGHETHVAYDGPAALVEAHRKPPEVALLDIGMPGMDGYALARRIRQEEPCEDTTLVAITAYSGDEYRRRASE